MTEVVHRAFHRVKLAATSSSTTLSTPVDNFAVENCPQLSVSIVDNLN